MQASVISRGKRIAYEREEVKLICSPWFARIMGTVNVGVTRACKAHGWMRDSLARTSGTMAVAGLYFSCTRKIHLVVRHTGLSLGTIASSCCRAHGYRVSFIVSAARIPAFASKRRAIILTHRCELLIVRARSPLSSASPPPRRARSKYRVTFPLRKESHPDLLNIASSL